MDHSVSKKPTSNAIITIIMIFATALGINKSYEQFPGQKLKKSLSRSFIHKQSKFKVHNEWNEKINRAALKAWFVDLCETFLAKGFW